jgi:antitoxin (DNA-binding transcriptional repressor) of toxin-antitoxin stability system
LREVKAGERFTITCLGEALADLVPSETARRGDPGAVIDRFREFLRRNPVSLHKTSIKALLEVERT